MDQFKPPQLKMFIAIQLIILAIALGAGFWFFKQDAKVAPPIKPVETAVVDPTLATIIARTQIQWEKNPVTVSKLGIFNDIKSDWESSKGGRESSTEYFKVGRVTAGAYAGADVIMAESLYEAMGYNNARAFFIVKDGVNYSVPGIPNQDPFEKYLLAGKTVNAKIVIEELDLPEQISSAIGSKKIVLEKYSNSFFKYNETDLQAPTSTIVFTDAVVGPVYHLHENIDIEYVFGRSGKDAFLVKLPFGRGILYTFIPEIIEEKNTVSISLNNNVLTSDAYSYVDIGGCGAQNFISLEPKVSKNDLVKFGVANRTGESVYALKDVNHALLVSAYTNYEASMKMQQKTIMPMAAFVRTNPVFFWEDPFGRLVKFVNRDYLPMGECGKPVIYLYPESTQKVDVKIDVKGGMSYSDPTYNEGWSVVATPSSQLTNLSDNKIYPYLFWEGRGGMYQSPQEGFVVARANVHSFLVEKLTAYGLNEKEIADFVEFWEPRMQAAPFYFVGFHGTQVMNAIAPLTVTPQPDSVFRILMDYKPLEKEIRAKEPRMPRPFKREGFTLVEWGGVIRGND